MQCKLLSLNHCSMDMSIMEISSSLPRTAFLDAESHDNNSETIPIIYFEFEDVRDRETFECLSKKMCYLIWMYLITCSITFCGSILFYPKTLHNQLEYILLMNDMVTIDISSAIVVVSGFLASFVFKRSVDCPFVHIILCLWSDLWLATFLILIVGTMQKIFQHDLNLSCFVLTLFEGITGIRVFDLHQNTASLHSWNIFAWIVQCMLISMCLMPGTYAFTNRLHVTFQEFGLYIIGFLCCGGIVLLSTFSSLAPNSNIFYANVSNIGYRIVEFNLGVNLLYLYTCAEPCTNLIFQVFCTCQTLISIVFACVWWSEIGILAADTDEPCVRLYYQNGCMRDHAAVLLRGCVLGLTVIASCIKSTDICSKKMDVDIFLITGYGSILLCTPIFTIICGLLELSFTTQAVHDNIAVISICMPAITVCVVYAYNLRCKCLVVNTIIPLHETIYSTFCRSYNFICAKYKLSNTTVSQPIPSAAIQTTSDNKT